MKNTLVLLVLLFVTRCSRNQQMPTSAAQIPDFHITRSASYTQRPLGVNMSSPSFWDAILKKNLFTQNPSMQAQASRGVFEAHGGTATSFDWFTWATVPPNLWQGYTYVYACKGSSGPTPGNCGGLPGHYEVGTIASSTPAIKNIVTFVLKRPVGAAGSFGAHDSIWIISPDDLAMTSSQLKGYDWTNFGWKTESDTDGVAIDSAPEDLPPAWNFATANQCVKLSILGIGDSASIYQYFDASSAGANYHFNGSYTQSIWVKQLSGSRATLEMFGDRSGSQLQWNEHVKPTGTWQRLSVNFKLSESQSQGAGTVREGFRLTGKSPASVCVFNADLRSDTDTNPTEFRDAIVEQWKYLKPGVARSLMDGNIGTGLKNLLKPAGYRQPSMYLPQQIGGDAANLGPQEFFGLQEYLGTPEVSMVISLASDDAELNNWVDYLAGNASTTYGGYRDKLGHAAPWTDVFKKVRVELGNETWNGGLEGGLAMYPLYSNAGEAYWNYVTWAVHACSVMKSNPNWNPGRMECSVSNQNSGYQMDQFTMVDSGRPRKIDTQNIFGYGMYSITSCSDTDQFQSSYLDAILDATPKGLQGVGDAITHAQKVGYKVFVYEHGNHTIGNGSDPQTSCTQAQIKGFPEGKGQGLIDTFKVLNLCRELGVCSSAKWRHLQYDYGIKTTAGDISIANWGMFTGSGGQFTQPRGSAVAMNLVNTALGPNPTMYRVTRNNVPTFDFPAKNKVPAQNGVPLMDAFAFSNEISSGILVYNFDGVQHSYTVSGDGVPSSGTVTETIFTGNGIKASNEGPNATPQLGISTTSKAVGTYTIPPYSSVAITWKR